MIRFHTFLMIVALLPPGGFAQDGAKTGSEPADKKGSVAAAAFSPDNPALREAMFVAEEPASDEEPSALSVLRRLFANPAP